jgi:hypothetical protein
VDPVRVDPAKTGFCHQQRRGRSANGSAASLASVTEQPAMPRVDPATLEHLDEHGYCITAPMRKMEKNR